MVSRELDVEVAEKVMGWKHAHGCGKCCAPANFHRWQRPDGEWRTSAEMPRYSTDIAAAWLVVEWLAGMDYSTRTCRIGGSGNHNWAHVKLAHRSSGGYGAEAETMPEAICRAALQALAADAERQGEAG